MFSAFSAIQFANAGALLAAFAVPLLILAYLKKRNLKKRTVSSVLILRSLRRQAVLRRSFKPPLRFWLELAALLLLVLAGAAPSEKEGEQHIAVIIDTSLSMRARSGSQTRLDEAKAAAARWIEDRSGSIKYSIFTSAPKLTPSGPSGADKARALKALAGISASMASDSIEAAASELAQSLDFNRILIVTDRKAETLPPAGSVAAPAAQSRTVIDALTVGSPISNLFVSDIRIAAAREAGEQERITASVGFSGEGEVRFRAGLSRRVAGGGEPKPAGGTSGQAAAGRTTEISFALPGQADRDEIYRLQIAPDPPSSSSSKDGLLEDDFAWVSGRGGAGPSVLLVTPSGSPDVLGLKRIPSLDVSQASPEEYARMQPKELDRYAVLAFHGSAPAAAPRRATLLIVPPAENPIFPSAVQYSGGKISSWKSEHPITSYLRLDLLNAGAGIVFAPVPWAQPVISVERGPIVIAGESQGVRFAGIGIEVLPFEGVRTPALSILTLNTLNWLLGGAELSTAHLTGSSVRLEGGRKWTVEMPQGRKETIDLSGGGEQSFTFEEPGPYLIRSMGTPPDQRIAAVNSFFPAESATALPAALVVPEAVLHDQPLKEAGRPLWPYLAGLALFILIAEILVRSKKEAEAA